jgi:hypothetical protein
MALLNAWQALSALGFALLRFDKLINWQLLQAFATNAQPLTKKFSVNGGWCDPTVGENTELLASSSDYRGRCHNNLGQSGIRHCAKKMIV